MTNTTELRKRFDTEVNKWLDPMSDYGGKELVDFLISEIEAAEKAKVEECIDILKRIACFEVPVTNERDQGFVDALDHAISQIQGKFLTKHDDERP